MIKKPAILTNAKGAERTVGLELEFAGVELKRTAQLVQDLYGGNISKNHRYEYTVTDTCLGDFRVELDARILRKMAQTDLFNTVDLAEEGRSIKKSLEDVVDKLARSVVPIEVVMPPVKIGQIEELEKLRQALQAEKAEGTKVSVIHIFGMHLNVETPDLEIDTLLRYLRSFMILYPWLSMVLDVDIARRVSPYVDPFPPKYVEKVLDENYEPDQAQFIDDYLEFNPTRNRPVDMMPILALFDQKKVKNVLKDEKNSARPTFHYRLPNSKIDESDWSFSEEWNYWWVVEKLAQDQEMLFKLSRLYLLRKERTLVPFKKDWAETVNILLDLNEFK